MEASPPLISPTTGDFSWLDVQIWSVVDFSRVRSMQSGTGVSAVRFSPDDTRLVTADWDTVTVWNVADGSRAWSRRLSSCEQLGEVMFSPDGSQVVSACNSGLNRILRASDGSLIQEKGNAPPGPGSVSYYDDDHILIGDDTRGARIWAREATGLFAPSCFLTSERPPPSGASPDGKEGPAVLATSPGGRQMYLHGNFENSSWIYEQAP
jgi:WD40 repeat protein